MIDPEVAKLVHEGATIITALAAVIAAVSSLNNGRTLNGKVNRKLEDALSTKIQRTSQTETGNDANANWYKPPDLS